MIEQPFPNNVPHPCLETLVDQVGVQALRTEHGFDPSIFGRGRCFNNGLVGVLGKQWPPSTQTSYSAASTLDSSLDPIGLYCVIVLRLGHQILDIRDSP